MPLFDVPGWTVPTAPVAEQSSGQSKKRKRSSAEPERLLQAEVNLDKLVKKIKGGAFGGGAGGDGVSGSSGPKASVTSKGKKGESVLVANGGPDHGENGKQLISRPKPLKPVDKSSPQPSNRSESGHHRKDSSSTSRSLSLRRSIDGKTSNLTALQQGMKQSLDGARFRIINENLYKKTSQEAHQLMREDPNVFEEYHVGFRHQVQSWPTNPVEQYIKTFTTYPPSTFVVDLGCGDAALAKALLPKGIKVASFDLVSDGAFVVEADICSKIPLPGSEGLAGEKSYGEGHMADVVVCALSLMGTNWPNCLREAWRILVPDGELRIAEVASRFTDVEGFQSLICSIGFKFISKDDSNTHFTLFEFRKIARKWKGEKEWSKLLSKGALLKPCEYKRR
ncbi:hypothetical protein AX16_000148 [Volvariella volvacea WC 439]|nr:hypothetical protein AX16_000148 [Volvariella volvacea WC 439]